MVCGDDEPLVGSVGSRVTRTRNSLVLPEASEGPLRF